MEEEQEGLHWDKPHFFDGSTRFIPKIFDSSEDEVPSGFNSVVISLEGGMRASLEWQAQAERARVLIGKGFKILWDIDLGLCGGLHYPYGNAMQHHSLGLALEHFRDTLWSEFRLHSLGLIIYRGNADYSHHFVWDDQQRANFREWSKGRGEDESQLYCTRVAVDYMHLLAMRLPDTLRLFVLLDCTSVQNLKTLSQLISRERYDPIHLALKGSPFADQELAWQEGRSSLGFLADKQLATAPEDVRVAFVLPSLETTFPAGLAREMERIQSEGIPFRIIPEPFLTTEWDELDQLIYSEEAMSPQGRRKLQGFCAAGGKASTFAK